MRILPVMAGCLTFLSFEPVALWVGGANGADDQSGWEPPGISSCGAAEQSSTPARTQIPSGPAHAMESLSGAQVGSSRWAPGTAHTGVGTGGGDAAIAATYRPLGLSSEFPRSLVRV